MSAEGKVKEALQLLQEAGHLEMLREEALSALRPARRAASGVAAAVLACSSLCRMSTKESVVRVRRRGEGTKIGGPCQGAGKGNPCPPRKDSVLAGEDGGPPSQRERLGPLIMMRLGRDGGVGRASRRSQTPPLLQASTQGKGKPQAHRQEAVEEEWQGSSVAQDEGAALFKEGQGGLGGDYMTEGQEEGPWVSESWMDFLLTIGTRTGGSAIDAPSCTVESRSEGGLADVVRVFGTI
ncbi:hypothetical protein NDU88_005450 [Pleurodeles waltl]|uniref:Uncharacterized protein n=1 Tax=Pleurodeles waltl TaxID=8319 RepID=A0AAV7SLU6_PLEWA|nr:hypothetical protein NDU88_005450 [Pleurodeles waltl]